MDAALLFQWSNLLILPGWLLLAIAPRWQWTGKLIYSGAYSAVYALLYLIVLITIWDAVDLDFSSLVAVRELFQSDEALLMGWVHYLAFDLFIAGWMMQDSWSNNIRHVWMLPTLFLTLYLGPVGFLTYILLRQLYQNKAA